MSGPNQKEKIYDEIDRIINNINVNILSSKEKFLSLAKLEEAKLLVEKSEVSVLG